MAARNIGLSGAPARNSMLTPMSDSTTHEPMSLWMIAMPAAMATTVRYGRRAWVKSWMLFSRRAKRSAP